MRPHDTLFARPRGLLVCLFGVALISSSVFLPRLSATPRAPEGNAYARAAVDSRLDMALRVLLMKASQRPENPAGVLDEAMAQALTEAGVQGIPVLIRGQVRRADLEVAGAHPQSQIGTVTTAHVPLEALASLLEVTGIESVEMAAALTPQLDVSAQEIDVGPVWRGTPPQYSGLTGRGVVIGIVDTGIDLNHADFRTSANRTRVKYLWDQSMFGTPPSGFTYGTEWTQSQIDAGSSTEIDDNGHGTHIAGIAAGNGRGTGNGQPAYQYVGVAPEADLIIVKSKLLLESDILDGVNYIFQKATALSKNAVVLLAVNNQLGAHDGTSTLDVGLSALTRPGKLVVVSAGNYGNQALHSRVTLPANGSAAITFTIPTHQSSIYVPEYLDIEGWHEPTASFRAKLTSPTGQTTNWVDPGTEAKNTSPDGSMILKNATVTNSKGARLLRIGIWQEAVAVRAGTWTLDVQRQSGASSGVLDAWISNWKFGSTVSPVFTSQVDFTRLVANGATGDSVISVGAYTTKTRWTIVNGNTSWFAENPTLWAIAAFSGSGPRRDGVQRPDVTAPGQGVVSALSVNAGVANTRIVQDGVHWVNRGTSAAAAQVAGSLALILQETPGLSPSAARNKIKQRARGDQFTGALPNAAWGLGKLDLALSTTGVVDPMASHLALPSAFPNPGRGMTTFDFALHTEDLRAGTSVRLRIVDVRGREVLTLRGRSVSGAQRLIWDGRMSNGMPAPSGIYVARLEVGERSASRKLVRLPSLQRTP